MDRPKLLPDFESLPTPDKIAYVQALWDHIAREAEADDLTDAQRAELDRRITAYRTGELELHSWEDVRASILAGR